MYMYMYCTCTCTCIVHVHVHMPANELYTCTCTLLHSAPAGPKIVLVPPQSMFILCLFALGRYHAVYTRCIGRIHSLATTSGPTRKVGTVNVNVVWLINGATSN